MPKWSIIVGKYVYRINLPLYHACQIAEKLEDEVLNVSIKRQTSTVERVQTAS